MVEFVLGVSAEVVSFGEILAYQAVGVFVDAALPWAVWVGEVDLDAGVAVSSRWRVISFPRS